MAFEKVLNTRIINKNADFSEWSTSTLPLKQGEIALAKFDAKQVNPLDGSITSFPAYAIKVGQEGKTFAEAAWLYAPASDVHAWAKKSALDYADLPGTLKTEIDDLQAAIGDNGSVATAIKNAIEALDVAESKDTDTENGGIIISAISEVDGKISVTRRALTDADIANLNVAMNKVTGLADTLALKADKTQVATDIATAIAPLATTEALNGVDAKFANYNTKEAQKAIDDAQDVVIGKKVDKVEGKDLIATSEIERLATLKNYDDTALAGRVTTAEGKITALETESAKHALKTDVEAEFAKYTTTEAQTAIDNEQNRRLGVIEGDYLKAADIANFETKENVKKVADNLAAYVESNDAAVADRYTKAEADGKFALIADAYDDTEVRGLISDNADAIKTETERATGIEAGLRTDVDAIKGDYLKAADKTELEGKITANANAITALTDGIDPDKIDGLTDLVNWANEHAPEVESIKKDIEANAKAIADQATSDADTYETKADATSKKNEIDGRLGALEGKVDVEKVSTAIADAVKVETDRATGVENGLDGRIKDLEDNKAGYATTGEVATAKSEAIAEAGKLDTALHTTITGEIATAKSEAIEDAAGKYETIGTAQGIVDSLKLGETYEPIGAEARATQAAKDYVDGKEFAGIKSTDIAAWNNEIGAKELAGTKTTTAEVKTQIEAYGYALDSRVTEVDNKFADYTKTTELEGELDLTNRFAAKADKSVVDAMYTNTKIDELVAGAKSGAEATAAAALAEYKTSNDAALAAVKGTADTAVQTVEGAANSGLTASKTGTKVTIDFDSNCVFVFDCGNHQA